MRRPRGRRETHGSACLKAEGDMGSSPVWAEDSRLQRGDSPLRRAAGRGSDKPPAHTPGPVRDSLASAPCGRRRRSKYSSVCALTHAHATGMCVHNSSPVRQKKQPHLRWSCFFGDPYGTPRLRAGRGAALTCHRHVIHSRALRVPRGTRDNNNSGPA